MYIKADWDDSKYVRIGNMMLPTDASGYGNMTGEEISRRVTRDYQDEMARQEAQRKAEEEARMLAIRHQQEAELGAINYQKAMEVLDPSASADDQLEALHELFVPMSGKSDNVAGELARAMMRLIYRDYNDGDVFYDGYGLETCIDSAAYIIDVVTDPENVDELGDKIEESFMSIASNATIDEAYTSQLQAICDMLLQFLMEHPELFGRESEDSRSYRSRTIDAIKDAVPEYEYECDLSGDLERYIENGCISYDDDIYSWIRDMCYEYGGELHQRALDWFEIVGLSPAELETWESEFPDRVNSYLDYLESEFPNYGEEEEEEEEYYDDDEDEEGED